ncbi:heparinase II/III family protein, partial [bacterium]|nr:heparinase II/III family protein [bacterium]
WSPSTPASARAAKFTPQAGNYAAFQTQESTPEASFLNFILAARSPPSEVRRCSSAIYPDGGAFFNECSDSDRALSGALWNCKTTHGHSHKDVNAIHLAAYGEHVLRNAGYAGWANGDLGYPWTYIHDTARANNIVLIEHCDHSRRQGGGIIEGLTAESFDFARGDSADALGMERHYRNFCMIHSRDGIPGYFLTLDEVDLQDQVDMTQVLFHPNSDNATVITTNTEYLFRVSPDKRLPEDVYLSIFFATRPEIVRIEDGLLANYSGGSFVGKYLNAGFTCNQSSAAVRILTTLYPHDSAHAKPPMRRIETSCYDGLVLDHDSAVQDIAIATRTENAIMCEGTYLEADTAWWRKKNETVDAYFVRQGNYFESGSSAAPVGFRAHDDVTLYVQGSAGKIITPGGQITFNRPGLFAMIVDGHPPTTVRAGGSYITIELTPGSHDLRFFAPDLTPASASTWQNYQ